jgi:hypothetical protein
MNEIAIKAQVLQRLCAEGAINQHSILASEWVLGSTGRRADLAIWNGQLVGIEIKSKFDSLNRLAAQLDVYVRCFDRVILVVDSKHLAKVGDDMRSGVELWCVGDDAQLSSVASPLSACGKDSTTLAMLCTAAQLKRLTMTPLKARISRKELVLWAAQLPSQLLASVVCTSFQNTFCENSAWFWRSIGVAKIEPSHIAELSRFIEVRRERSVRQQAQNLFWQKWTSRADELFAS